MSNVTDVVLRTVCSSGVFDCAFEARPSGLECALGDEGSPADMDWAIWVALLMAGIMAFGIGANDSANSWGSSVGSGAVSLRAACLVGGTMEFVGAVLLGDKVAGTISKGVADLKDPDCWACGYCDSNMRQYTAGMLGAMFGALFFIFLSTFSGLPVSGTHAVVGGVVSMTITLTSFGCLNWGMSGLSGIVASWVVSPILSGVICLVLFYCTERWVLQAQQPRAAAVRVVPFLYALASMTVVAVVLLKSGPTEHMAAWLSLAITFASGFAMIILAQCVLVPYALRHADADAIWKPPADETSVNSGASAEPSVVRASQIAAGGGDGGDGSRAQAAPTPGAGGADDKGAAGADEDAVADPEAVTLIDKSAQSAANASAGGGGGGGGDAGADAAKEAQGGAEGAPLLGAEGAAADKMKADEAKEAEELLERRLYVSHVQGGGDDVPEEKKPEGMTRTASNADLIGELESELEMSVHLGSYDADDEAKAVLGERTAEALARVKQLKKAQQGDGSDDAGGAAADDAVSDGDLPPSELTLKGEAASLAAQQALELRAKRKHHRARGSDTRTDNEKGAIVLFKHPLVFIASLESFAHGANDTANATGPMSAVYQTVTGGSQCSFGSTPVWIMAYAGFCVFMGINLFGARVIKTMGSELTVLDYHRAFCVELSAMASVIIATMLKFPVSTTHCQVGALVACGLIAAGRDGVEWHLLARVGVSWLLTLPIAGVVAFVAAEIFVTFA